MADKGEAPAGPSRKEKGKAKVGEPSDYDSGDDQINEPGPVSGKDNGKAKVGEPSNYDSGDDQTVQINEPGPVSGDDSYSAVGPLMCFLFSKTLMPDEVRSSNPVLYFNVYETSALLKSPDIITSPKPGPFQKFLIIFDVEERSYKMLLSNCGRYGFYSLTDNWKRFVEFHHLTQGDEISFHRSRDINTRYGDYIYIITKKSGKQEAFTSDEDAYQESSILAKTLISQNVVPEDSIPTHEQWLGLKPRFSYLLLATYTDEEERHNIPRTLSPYQPTLRVDGTFDAYVLLDCPKYVPLDVNDQLRAFRVFDVDGTPYNFQLLNFFRYSVDFFVLNSEFDRFIQDHNLEPGDEIYLDKKFDLSVWYDIFYILKFVRKSESSKNDDKSGKNIDDGAKSINKIRLLEKPVLKVIYHRLLLTPYGDQAERSIPGSRKFPLEAICLSKTLSQGDVGNLLFLDHLDAIILSDNQVRVTTNGFRPMKFRFFDIHDGMHMMMFHRNFRKGGLYDFCLQGWGAIVSQYGLKKGDVVAFYKFLDKRVSKDFYYVVLKLPEVGNRDRIIIPVSRPLLERLCFCKVIFDEYVQLSVSEAEHFLSSSSFSHGTFVVYDVKGTRYYMSVSYFVNYEGVLICCLDHEWKSFIKNNHLSDGSIIYVYKQLVGDEEYLVLEPAVEQVGWGQTAVERVGWPQAGVERVRWGGPGGSGQKEAEQTGLPNVSGASGVGPSGSGWKEAEQAGLPSGSGARGVGPSGSGRKEAEQG